MEITTNTYQKEEDFLNGVKDFTESTQWEMETISDSRVGFDSETLKHFVEGEKKHILNEYGKYSLPARAGLAGSVINDLIPQDWENVVNTCFPYREGKMKLNILNNEVYAAHSDSYVIVNTDDVFLSANQILKTVFPNIEFISGSITPQLLTANFSLLKEQKVVDFYESALNTAFDNNDRLVCPSIEVVTSNTGDSGVNIYPTLNCKSELGVPYTIIVGSAIKMEHKGKCSIEKFRENLTLSFSLMKKSSEKIVALTYVMINNPVSCFLNIAQRLSLPKPAAIEIASTFDGILDGGRTQGRFIYLALTKIIEKQNSGKKLGKNAEFALAENIGRALSLDMQQYDTKYCEWLNKPKEDVNQLKLAI